MTVSYVEEILFQISRPAIYRQADPLSVFLHSVWIYFFLYATESNIMSHNVFRSVAMGSTRLIVGVSQPSL